jgi:dTDP-4-amino-4,6-dideoxygalactose transaminase
VFSASENGTPALLGGTPVRDTSFPSWPRISRLHRQHWKEVLDAKGWCRLNGDFATRFEKAYAEMNGAKECLAVNSGTSSLYCSLNALGVGPGDEVLVPPYTFVDTDRNTFQIDAQKLEDKITKRTKCILPVHLGGNVADMDTIMAVAKKHNLYVIEDACQSHLAEWKGKNAGSIGDTGCFSFQVTKNLSSGEGGALLSSNQDVMDRCYSFHSNGRERNNTYGFQYSNNGANIRMTEFQASLLLSGLDTLDQQSTKRSENAAYLDKLLSDVEGLTPASQYEGTTRNAYHLYMMRYDPSAFKGLPREKFLAALQAEGIPCASGYSPLNKEPFFEKTLHSNAYSAIYEKDYLDKVIKESACPENDILCEEAVWFFQFMLLSNKKAMEDIAAAVKKIQANAEALMKA